MKYAVFAEPIPNMSGDSYYLAYVCFKDAVETTRANCIRIKGQDLYKSDEEAFQDFLSIHQAREEKRTT